MSSDLAGLSTRPLATAFPLHTIGCIAAEADNVIAIRIAVAAMRAAIRLI
jgi:hypothetical protein